MDNIRFWMEFGFIVIPFKLASETPAIDVADWCGAYSPDVAEEHFGRHKLQRRGIIVPEGVVGFRARDVQHQGSLRAFLQHLDAMPVLWPKNGPSFYRCRNGDDWIKAVPDGVEAVVAGDIILAPAIEPDRVQARSINDLELLVLPTSTADIQPLEGMELVKTPLAGMSVRGQAALFEERAINVRPLLGNVAMMGQGTVWYAPPNSGKTLFMLALLIQAIENGLVLADNCYFINADDNEAGIAQKLRLLDDVGAHTLVPGEGGFEPSIFTDQLDVMAESDSCRGVVVMLDTIKKCADLMDKKETSRFASSVRRFTQKGGTFIGLAHTRKNPSATGKLVYGGTTDLTEDCDAVFMLNAPYDSASTGEKIVKFESLKKRGGGVEEAYAFAADAESYDELLTSVRLVVPSDLEGLGVRAEHVNDQSIFDAVIACLQDGPQMKMPLVSAVATRAKVSKRAALRIIEQFGDSGDGQGHWSYTVQARGAKVYSLPPGD